MAADRQPRSVSRGGLGAVTVVGIVLGAAALGFVVLRLRDNYDEAEAVVRDADLGWLVVALLAAAAAMMAMAAPWRDVLRVFGVERPRGDTIARYFAGEIGKYLPGGVWPLIGRGELVARVGVPRSAAYGSVAMSLGCLYVAASLLVVVAIPLELGGAATWTIVLAVVGVGALHPRPFGVFLSILGRVSGSSNEPIPVPSWGTGISLVLRYLPAWVLVGTSTWLVAVGLGERDDVLRVIAAGVLSWIVGFVVAPVPGGIGIREAAFVAACGLPAGTGAAVALVSRMVFVAVDALGAVIAGAWLGRRSVADRATASSASDAS